MADNMMHVRPFSKRMRLLLGRSVCLSATLLCLASGELLGQGLTISSQREVAPPDYATFRIGPLYSTVALTETVGYRYTTSSGTGTDYLYQNNRGVIREDGSDFPILSTLTFRNYLIISRNMDLDMSFRLGYYYYPLGTQEDEFVFDMAEEGIYGNISTAFRLSDVLTGTLYDHLVYRTDYVDTRGVQDEYGGSKYEYFSNTIGGNMNWAMGRDHSTAFGLSRYDLIPSDEEFADQESYQYRASATYRYQVRNDLAVGLFAQYRDVNYTVSDRSDITEESYSLYLNFGREGGEDVQITQRSTLRLSLGTTAGYTADVERGSDETGSFDDDNWDDGKLYVVGAAELETLLTKRTTQLLSYRRGLRDGFNSAFEEYDTAEYRLKWASDFTSVDAFSRLNNVNPSLANDTDYQDWVNGVGVSWRATKVITIGASSTYTLRTNDSGDVVDTSALDTEDVNDYETWVSRIGTSFKISREVTFSTSLQHVERFSDDEDLAYSRETFLTTLSYHHQF